MTGATNIPPVKGDPATEQVAANAQSNVDGRVGPATIAQDSRSPHTEPGVVKVAPGDVEDVINPGP
jgi:hypothetical protein